MELAGQESRNIAARVRGAFDELEDQAIEQDVRSQGTVDGRLRYTGQRLDAGRHATIPLRVRNAFRLQEPNGSIYYLEILRDYGAASSPGVSCPGLSYLRTWVRTNADAGLVSIEQQFRLIDCDGVDVALAKLADLARPRISRREGG